MAVAARGGGVLILSPEAAAHFYPATPEQVVNACYAAGFRMVNRGVVGDELVAAEYLAVWRDDSWGTIIRSTDPVVVDTVRRDYPELVPYLAPVTIPAVAEARYLRALVGEKLEIVFAGVCPPAGRPELDAAVTFRDLEQLFRLRGVSPLSQPDFFLRVPSERRRHLSTAGGLPVQMLEEVPYSSKRFRKVRGLKELKAIARAVVTDRLDLGFIDILSHEGWLDHPLSGPREELFWRRAVVASTEPPRSRYPVVDQSVVASYGATFQVEPRLVQADPTRVEELLEPPQAPRTFAPDIDPGLESVILRCLERDPAARFQTAGAIARALQDDGVARTVPALSAASTDATGPGVIAICAPTSSPTPSHGNVHLTAT